jgi:hypothetical protein
LEITQITIDEFDWVAIGFKTLDNPSLAVKGADVVNIFFGSDPVDSYAECDCAPTMDETLKSTNDLTDVSYFQDHLTYVWTREMITGDKYDVQLEEGAEYKVLFASGIITDGVQIGHGLDDCGLVNVHLTNDFYFGCGDLDNLIKNS